MRKSLGFIIVFAILAVVAASLTPTPVAAIQEWNDCHCYDWCGDQQWWCQEQCGAYGPPAPYCLAQCNSQYNTCTGRCGFQEQC